MMDGRGGMREDGRREEGEGRRLTSRGGGRMGGGKRENRG